MRQEREHGPEDLLTIEEIARLARELTLRDGSHAPTIIAEGYNRRFVGELSVLPGTHMERVHIMGSVGFTLAKSNEVGKLRQVFFICEGWMSILRGDEVPQVPPSQDPQRKEILLISALNVELHQAKIAAFEMVRTDDGVLKDLKDYYQDKSTIVDMQSPLLDAFVDGFRRGREQVN